MSPFTYLRACLVDMGGMFTVLKVRDDLDAPDAHGWYSYPEGSVARRADPARLAADGIDVT